MKHTHGNAAALALGAAIGVVLACAAACNSITGLDDYEKVECVGACGAGTSDANTADAAPDNAVDVIDPLDSAMQDALPDVDASLDGGPDVLPDVELESSVDVSIDAMEAGVLDPRERWARWPMPHEHIPDGGGPTLADVEVQSDHYYDRVTKLTWLRSESDAMPFGQAVGVCESKSGANYRLPTRIELITLLEPSLDPPIYSALAGDVNGGDYWTLSEVNTPGSSVSKRWVIDFKDGFVKTKEDAPGNEAFVRCILDVPE